MKNMKISAKLLVSFMTIIALSLIIGVIGTFGLLMIDSAYSELISAHLPPLPHLSKVIDTFQRMRVNTREYVIGTAVDDTDRIDTAYTAIEEYKKTMTENLDQYEEYITDDDVKSVFKEARSLYESSYISSLKKQYELAKAGDTNGIIAEQSNAKASIDTIIANFEKCMELDVANTTVASNADTKLSQTMAVIVVCVIIVSLIVSVILGTYISRLISKPAVFMKDVLARIGTKGDIDFTDAEYKQTELYASGKDEIAQSVAMMLTMVRRLVKVGEALHTVAGGDLTADLALLSERDTMGLSLQKMNENLNNMFSEINNSTSQVSTGSKQIADGAQALAQGSTQQAAAVEQLSASITDIAQKTRDNADMATRAANLAHTIKDNAEKGSRQMDEMMTAVKEINEASQSINKVIKVIDDIAFQTNILALNAAVEAARAGQHGKGFAVVAEEVRSLAAKSAEAAKDTGALIANSMEKAELGSRIANETSVSLTEIVSGINESNQIVGDIADSSKAQSAGIEQINNGINQVAQVIQQNSATAEESAAASEEMSGQANMLEELVAQFKLKDGNRSRRSLSSSTNATQRSLSMPPKNTFSSGDEFGKY